MPELDIKLQPKQRQLLRLMQSTGPRCPIRIGWGGSRGAAKSGGLRRVAMVLAGEHKEIVVVIVRKHYDDLVENHVEKMQLEYPEFHARFYQQSKKQWALSNGSRIKLAYGDTPKDIQEFSRGPEFTFLLVDQAEQFSERELIDLTIPNRWPGSSERFAKSAFFFNPGGPGTEYLRRIFHKREFHEEENAEDYIFIQAYGWDNYEWFRGEVTTLPNGQAMTPRAFYALDNDTRFQIFIMQTSEGRKMNALPASKRLGELYGRFDKFSGQYYAEVWDENTCVLPTGLADSLIQPWWTRWIAQDWGFGHHNVNVWFAAGKLAPKTAAMLGINTEWPIDVIVAYREMVVSEMGEEAMARRIAELTPEAERKYISAFWLSFDAFDKRGSGNTIAEQLGGVLRQEGLPSPTAVDKDRVGGCRLVYNCLQRNVWRKGDPVPHEAAQTGPLLLVSAGCPEIIDAIPMLVRDEKDLDNVEKKETKGDDVFDTLRYGVKMHLDPKGRAPAAVRAIEVYQAHEDPTDRAIAIRRFEIQEKMRSHLSRRARAR